MTKIRLHDLGMSTTKLAWGVVVVAMMACTSATSPAGDSRGARPVLTFQNDTIDPVTVFIEIGGNRVLIGHVEPGRRANLRLPGVVNHRDGIDLRLIVAPHGTRPKSGATFDVDTTIYSEFEPAQHLLSVMWSLNGHRLVGLALPTSQR